MEKEKWHPKDLNTPRSEKQKRKESESAAVRFLLFVGGEDEAGLDSAEVVARGGVCLMPVGFPARLPAGRVGHIAVRGGNSVNLIHVA